MNQTEQLLEARAILHSLFLKDTTEIFVSALREHGCSAPQCPCTRARKLLALEMPKPAPAQAVKYADDARQAEINRVFDELRATTPCPPSEMPPYPKVDTHIDAEQVDEADATNQDPPPAALDAQTPNSVALSLPEKERSSRSQEPAPTAPPPGIDVSAEYRRDIHDRSEVAGATRVVKQRRSKKRATSSRKALPALATSAGDPPSEPPATIPGNAEA